MFHRVQMRMASESLSGYPPPPLRTSVYGKDCTTCNDHRDHGDVWDHMYCQMEESKRKQQERRIAKAQEGFGGFMNDFCQCLIGICQILGALTRIR